MVCWLSRVGVTASFSDMASGKQAHWLFDIRSTCGVRGPNGSERINSSPGDKPWSNVVVSILRACGVSDRRPFNDCAMAARMMTTRW